MCLVSSAIAFWHKFLVVTCPVQALATLSSTALASGFGSSSLSVFANNLVNVFDCSIGWGSWGWWSDLVAGEKGPKRETTFLWSDVRQLPLVAQKHLRRKGGREDSRWASS